MKWLLIIILLVAGCHSDNRVRIKPTVTHSEINPELRANIIWNIWAQEELRKHEISQATD